MAAQVQVRVTGLVMKRGRLLAVRAANAHHHPWGVPQPQVLVGETLTQAVVREIARQSGYSAEVTRLLYLSEGSDRQNPSLHVIFECRKTSGERSVADAASPNPSWEVRWVATSQLTDAGFSPTFAELMAHGLPDAGSYLGADCDLGL